MSASMPPTVTRLEVSRSFGSCSVMSCNFTFSDGHRPILVEPAIVRRYPVSRSTRSWIADVKKPEGMPTNSNTATTTITAAMAAPAIFSALMMTFQTGQAASMVSRRSTAYSFPKLTPETGLAQSRQK